MSNKLESKFQAELIRGIRDALPEAIVMKLDSIYKQGVPDLLILHDNKWATLECKRSMKASHQPNQDWYVAKMDTMSFSRFICPENKETIMKELFDFLLEKKGSQNEIQ